MTLSSTTIKDVFNGDASTKAFATTWVFWNSSEVQAVLVSSSGLETTWTEGTEYTVTGGGGAVGTVTASTTPTDYTPALGVSLLLKSNVSDIQETVLPAGGIFPSTQVEQELDRTVRRIQQQTEELSRSITLSIASTYTDITLPDPEANTFLMWNSSADALENATLGNSTTALAVPVIVGQGGTGSSQASVARTNLGLAIDVNVQAYDADTAKLDVAQAWTAEQTFGVQAYFTPQTLTSSSNILTIDFDSGNYVESKLVENITTVTTSNMNAGAVYKLRLEQSSSASLTVTGWDSTIIWTNSDTDPVMNPTFLAYTMVTIESGSTSHMGSAVDYG